MDQLVFNYDSSGLNYPAIRRTDPRIAAYVHEALGGANTIVNIGAGTGSYEAEDKYTVAVEPSEAMRKNRLVLGKPPAVNAQAENLPFDENSFDAAMAMVTVHHWSDLEKGLLEMRRVSRGPVVVLTFDPDALDSYWNAHYFPELVQVEKSRYPPIDMITRVLGGSSEVMGIHIPLDCMDGFQEAFYGRPEAFLKKEVRKAQSAWGFLDEGMEEVLVKRLEMELKTGEWDNKYGHYRKMPECTFALRLVVARP